MTKLEQYTDSDRSDHEIAKSVIAHVLRNADAEDRFSGRELAEMVPVSTSTVRDLVVELRKDGHPVFNDRGYYLIQTDEQLETAIESIRDEIATKEQTIQELTEAFNNE